MGDSVNVYWSFRSPYSYLAIPELQRVSQDFDIDVALRVVLPIAVRVKEKLFDPANMKPILYILMDAQRRSEYLGIPYRFPPVPDPVVQDRETLTVAEDQPYIFRLSKLGVEAQRRGKGIDFAAAVSKIIFDGKTDNWHEGDHLARAADSAGLNLEELENAIDGGDHLAEIEQNQKDLDAAGHWGVPTMVLRDEPFFGQDRIATLRWRLGQLGFKKSP